MPVGNPIYFLGYISLVEKKPFGIFEVEAPKDINVPLLQLRLKKKIRS